MTVTITYFYPNGTVLDTDAHNDNIYNSGGGQSAIMSDANGGLTNSNLSSGFQILPEHVYPEQAARGRQEWGLEPLDYNTEGFSDVDEANFRPVAGCGIRMHVPYDCSLGLFQCSFFVDPWKLLLEVTQSEANDSKYGHAHEFAMFVRCRLNGTALTHTQRPIPANVMVNRGSVSNWQGTSVTRFTPVPNLASLLWYDFSHLESDVSAGWHNFDLTIYMEATTDPESSEVGQPMRGMCKRRIGKFRVDYENDFYGRLSFGVRNARAVTLL